MRRAATYLRGLDPQLPREVWLLQLGGLVNSLGTGLVLPYTLIYLHNARGIALAVAGAVLGWTALLGLVVGPLTGSLVDRFGAKRMLGAALVLLAGGFALYPLVRSAPLAFAAATLVGMGQGTFWPSQSNLLSRLTPPDRRHGAFAQQRVTTNLGVGIGAVVGGLVVTTTDPATFDVVFWANSVTFLLYLCVLAFVPGPPPLAVPAGEERRGYREVVRDRLLVGLVVLNAALVALGYGSIELLPAFGKNHNDVTEHQIGLVFLVNTLTIVVLQLPLSRALEGRRRMRGLAAMAALWGVACAVMLVAGATLEAGAAAVVFAVATMIFGVGECLHGATMNPLVSDIAPPALLGRYLALSTTSWSAAFVLAPAIGGAVLAVAPLGLWVIGIGLALACVAASLWLERLVPARALRTPRRR